MKKLLLSMIAVLLISNCYVLDSTGLNLDEEAIKGADAKNKILTYALIGAGPGGNTKLVQAFVSQVFMENQIDSERFYNATDVDRCAQNALGVNAFADAAVGIGLCRIKSKTRGFLLNAGPLKLDIPFIQ